MSGKPFRCGAAFCALLDDGVTCTVCDVLGPPPEPRAEIRDQDGTLLLGVGNVDSVADGDYEVRGRELTMYDEVAEWKPTAIMVSRRSFEDWEPPADRRVWPGFEPDEIVECIVFGILIAAIIARVSWLIIFGGR